MRELTKAVEYGTDFETFKRAQDLIEATIFLSDVPLKERRLADGLGLDRMLVTEALKVLEKEYQTRGILFRKGAAGWEFKTEPKLGQKITEFFELDRRRRLSQAALETLSVIAYHQPITRREIDEIRSVDSSYTVRALMERNLLKITGQRNTPGAPYEYAVSETFLQHFGLDSIKDLPQLQIAIEDETALKEELTIEAAELGSTQPEAVPSEPV